MKKTTDKVWKKVLAVLKLPSIKEKNIFEVKERARESLMIRLQRSREKIKKDGGSDKKIKQNNMER